MNTDSSGVTRLTKAPSDDARPTWRGRWEGSRPGAGKLTCLLPPSVLQSRDLAATSRRPTDCVAFDGPDIMSQARKLVRDAWHTASGKTAVVSGVFLLAAALVHGCFQLSNTALEAYLEARAEPTDTSTSHEYTGGTLHHVLGCPTPVPLPSPEAGKRYVWKWELRGEILGPTLARTEGEELEPYPAPVFWMLGNTILDEPKFPARAYYLAAPGPEGQVPCESAGKWVLRP